MSQKKITGKCFRPEEILDSSIGYKMLGIFNQDMQLPYYNAMFSVLHFFKSVSGFKGTFGLMVKHIYKNKSFIIGSHTE